MNVIFSIALLSLAIALVIYIIGLVRRDLNKENEPEPTITWM